PRSPPGLPSSGRGRPAGGVNPGSSGLCADSGPCAAWCARPAGRRRRAAVSGRHVARTVRRLSGLRGRLLAAFTIVALPPFLLLALSVNVLVSRNFEKTAEQRLLEALAAAQREIEKKRERAREQVALVAAVDLPAGSEATEALARLASAIAP